LLLARDLTVTHFIDLIDPKLGQSKARLSYRNLHPDSNIRVDIVLAFRFSNGPYETQKHSPHLFVGPRLPFVGSHRWPAHPPAVE
jgi:hypothetical protein